MHVSLQTDGFPKTRYEIEFIDHCVTAKRNSSCLEDLHSIVGKKRTGWKNEFVRNYLQEDIIISFFSNILLSHWFDEDDLKVKPGGDRCCSNIDSTSRCSCIWLDLHKFSHKVIENYIRNLREKADYSDNRMYVGFCFETILEGGYGDGGTITGSLPLLSLALTRGSLQVNKNRGITDGLMDRQLDEDPSQDSYQFKTKLRKRIYFIHRVMAKLYHGSNNFLRRMLPRLNNSEEQSENYHDEENEIRNRKKTKWEDYINERGAIFEMNKKGITEVVAVNDLGRHPIFRSASPDYIKISTKLPNIFILMSFAGLGGIFAYGIAYALHLKP